MVLMHSAISQDWYIFDSISKFSMWSHGHNKTGEFMNEEFSIDDNKLECVQ